MKTEIQTAAAAPDALQDFTGCAQWGQGGQFIFDPATGQRTRVGQTPAAGSDGAMRAASVATVPAIPITPPKKEKPRG